MDKWTKHTFTVRNFPVKAYIHNNKAEAVIFFPFGRYIRLSTNTNILDFVSDFLFGNGSNIISFQGYVSSMDDTSLIQIDKDYKTS